MSAGAEPAPSGSFSCSASGRTWSRCTRRPAGLRIEGYVAALGDQGPVRGPQNVFVNRRIVKDRTIAHAIIEAYSVATIKERSPEVHLFIEMPPDRVDVNVHPTKAEVRFLEQSLVHEVLRRGARRRARRRAGARAAAVTPFDVAARRAAPDDDSRRPRRRQRREPVVAGAVSDRPADSAGDVRVRAIPRWTGRGRRCPRRAASSTNSSEPSRSGAADPAPTIRPMIPLGQFRDTFIIAVDDEGIAIIDQHVAHERMLFEQITEKLTSGRLESQRLLTPIVIELSPAQRAGARRSTRALLERFGLEVEEFGGGSVRLSAVPALLEPAECEAAVRALAEDLEGVERRHRASRTRCAGSPRPWRVTRR